MKKTLKNFHLAVTDLDVWLEQSEKLQKTLNEIKATFKGNVSQRTIEAYDEVHEQITELNDRIATKTAEKNELAKEINQFFDENVDVHGLEVYPPSPNYSGTRLIRKKGTDEFEFVAAL